MKIFLIRRNPRVWLFSTIGMLVCASLHSQDATIPIPYYYESGTNVLYVSCSEAYVITTDKTDYGPIVSTLSEVKSAVWHPDANMLSLSFSGVDNVAKLNAFAGKLKTLLPVKSFEPFVYSSNHFGDFASLLKQFALKTHDKSIMDALIKRYDLTIVQQYEDDPALYLLEAKLEDALSGVNYAKQIREDYGNRLKFCVPLFRHKAQRRFIPNDTLFNQQW